eukprot:2863684-Prymnesium_polylepis.1
MCAVCPCARACRSRCCSSSLRRASRSLSWRSRTSPPTSRRRQPAGAHTPPPRSRSRHCTS